MRSRITEALFGSSVAIAKLRRHKAAAWVSPPRAAPNHFPYEHRTCAEWKPRKKPQPSPVVLAKSIKKAWAEGRQIDERLCMGCTFAAACILRQMCPRYERMTEAA